MMTVHGYVISGMATDILGHIYLYYANRIIASCPNFTNFVSMATRVGWCKISLATFDGTTPKTPL